MRSLDIGLAIPSTTAATVDVEVVDVYTNDRAAVEAWLRSKPSASPHSIRAYRQAVGHLWGWLASRRGKNEPDALLNLKTHEAEAYFSDLLKAKTGAKQKDLSATTVKHRLTVLSAMYAHWLKPRDSGRSIVVSNPFGDLAKKIKADESTNMGATRALSADEQAIVEESIERLPRATGVQEKHYRRARLIWMLASRLALRRTEIARLRVNDIKLAVSGKWKIELLGKGRKENGKPDVVMVPDVVMDEIRVYRQAFGLHPDPLPSDSSFLIRHVFAGHHSSSVSDTHVARIMKEVFMLAAEHAERGLRAPHLAPILRKASIHWGRHTWFMNSLQEHDLRVVSRAGRHKDIRTTMKSYVGTSEDDLAKVMNSGKPIGSQARVK